MDNCAGCGKTIGMGSTKITFQDQVLAMCKECATKAVQCHRGNLKMTEVINPQSSELYKAYVFEGSPEGIEEKKQADLRATESFNQIYKFMTTANSIAGYNIVDYKGIINGDIVVPNGLLGVITDGTFFSISAFTKAREEALKSLCNSAISKDANAVIGVDIDVCDLNGNGFLVSANGTAVVIEKE